MKKIRLKPKKGPKVDPVTEFAHSLHRQLAALLTRMRVEGTPQERAQQIGQIGRSLLEVYAAWMWTHLPVAERKSFGESVVEAWKAIWPEACATLDIARRSMQDAEEGRGAPRTESN